MVINKGISIILCTYNGALLLPETLRHIANQRVPSDLAWELIIVDNASDDNTAMVAETEWAKYTCTATFHILHEPRQGLSFARELGFVSAKYPYIILCDDDNWLFKDYVAKAYSIMEQHPDIGMLGGHAELVYEVPPPKWAVTFSPGIHAGGPQARSTGEVPHFSVYGAGSVLRKSAYLAIREAGFQFKLTDRLGNQLSSGGDSELCYALSIANYSIWYDNDLRFKHFIQATRLTWLYYVNYMKINALSFIVLEPYKLFLNTRSTSLFVFYIAITRRVLHFTCSLLWTLLLKSILPGIENKKTKAIKVHILKARLGSYKYIKEMKGHFLEAGKYSLAFAKLAELKGHEQNVTC
ncbi:glycosyltransferase [Fibrivirga algicola]|uniref:Glycosyltransferase family 2 protein n=1 Tax=Fibrivirga algicola TaxID=2950420 RepID=A0ABX0QGP7_9BACT|nr:glycosyltransferase [Fibrivirga algicola]NID11063.1 glycosyltransferase family 2 protein [Fibrivirga algicola]